MEEQTYLEAPGISVTSTRITIHGQTFATRNVGSVSVQTIGRPAFPVILLVVGAVLLLVPDARVFGVFALIIGAIAYATNGPSWRLILLAGGGEVKALVSKNRKTVSDLHDAIVQAISVR